MATPKNTVLMLLIVGALVVAGYLFMTAYVPGAFEIVPPDYLDPNSSNYLKLTLINNGTTNDTMEFMMQFRHQKLIPAQIWTRTYVGVPGVIGYLSTYKATGQINQTQYDAGHIQLNAILSNSIPEPAPVVNETIIAPISGGAGGGTITPPVSDDEASPVSEEEQNGGLDMIEIAIWIMLGIVSMILAWLATVAASMYLPFIENPAGMIVSICGFFALIFYVMAYILGMV